MVRSERNRQADIAMNVLHALKVSMSGALTPENDVLSAFWLVDT